MNELEVDLEKANERDRDAPQDVAARLEHERLDVVGDALAAARALDDGRPGARLLDRVLGELDRRELLEADRMRPLAGVAQRLELDVDDGVGRGGRGEGRLRGDEDEEGQPKVARQARPRKEGE